jgi:hypothetical protein
MAWQAMGYSKDNPSSVCENISMASMFPLGGAASGRDESAVLVVDRTGC